MKLKINKDTCIGCAICPNVCSAIFTMNQSENKAEIIQGVDYKNYEEEIQDAISACPVNAISPDE